MRRGALVAIVIALIVAHGAAWRLGADRLRTAVDTWIDEQRAAGLSVSHGAIDVGGYPATLNATIDAARLGADGALQNTGGATAPWRWSADRLDVVLSALSPQSITLRPVGRQEVTIGASGPWVIEAKKTAARLSGGDDTWRAALTLSAPTLTPPQTAGAPFEAALARTLSVRLASGPGGETLDLSADADGVTTSAMTEAGLAARARITVTQSALTEDLAAWRAGGGRIVLRDITVTLPAASAHLSGALTLDALGFPAGALEADIENPAAFAKLLGDFGAVTPEQAAAAQAGLAMAAFTQGGRLKGPIVIENGVATFKGVTLARLAPLPLRAAPARATP
ncbi:MAG: DUF2125 domain-containing protein [Pseudomonadota bacterium]